MDDEETDIKKLMNHLITRSDQDFDTRMHLYNSKDFHWTLFMGHLVIERLLKAVVVNVTNTHAPFTHDLR